MRKTKSIKRPDVGNLFKSSENELKEEVTIKITKKEKDKITNDDFYTHNKNTIESYIKESKLSLEFLEKSILKNLKNYFSRDELEELNMLFNKQKNHIMDKLLNSDKTININREFYYIINRPISNRFHKIREKKRQLRLKIALKVYELKEYEIFALVHLLIENSYKLNENREYVESKLIDER